MIKYGLMACLIASSSLSVAGFLPLLVLRNAVAARNSAPTVLKRLYSSSDNNDDYIPKVSYESMLQLLSKEEGQLRDRNDTLVNCLVECINLIDEVEQERADIQEKLACIEKTKKAIGDEMNEGRQ